MRKSELEAIQARVDKVANNPGHFPATEAVVVMQDAPALLGEIKRLRDGLELISVSPELEGSIARQMLEE